MSGISEKSIEKLTQNIEMLNKKLNNIIELLSKTEVKKSKPESIKIEDFPLRGHTVSLYVKRRKWTIQDTNKVVSRDWDLVAKGTRKTHEFASFLKEINR